MSHEVYANSNEIAGKAGMGKVIASFPDVCLSPPGPPAGPIPIPYPDTSFSSALKQGSRTVMLQRKPAALSQQSYYQPSMLGDEAATRAWGMSVITHQITGKTYFQAWSMDVQIEGKYVCRHCDITTSNHASAPGVGAPNPNLEAAGWGELEDESPYKCACCNGPRHSAGKPMTMDDWYMKDSAGNVAPHAATYTTLMNDVNNRKTATPPCTCSSRLVPSAPCNVFRRPVTPAERQANKSAWNSLRDTYQGVFNVPSEAQVIANLTPKLGRAPVQAEIQDERQVNHLVPKAAAGGCPVGEGNLEKNGDLCPVCRNLDKRFGTLQSLASKA
ncbi:PAAR-like domain-containing protein [Pseudomonas mediterranea]|uniref:PAAR-like domain-containing protein n=1 Tax=Pseudomonas mediterranea TaxID=183795 RepID=UPI0006D8A187|nr:PAAR-like domain-containing protein [Pseudomonas mediterranea]